MSIQRPLPKSRLGRLGKLGWLAGSIAGGAISEGITQLSHGQRPSVGDLLLTRGNIKQVADRLSEMRGAAMKVGQLLSMESGELLPPELNQLLSRLREEAYSMPLGEVAEVLIQAWGDDWEKQFRRFSFTPLAAASIGQVHQAELKDGCQLAIKIQYPGIRRSIDSDVDNVATLLRFISLLPKEIDFTPLLEEAKFQLHREADYLLEAASQQQFASYLRDDPRFEIADVVKSHTTAEVLAMQYLDGQPIETVAQRANNERNTVAESILELAMQEIFTWGLVQTDPNFANYRYQAASRRVQLLDFGSTVRFSIARRKNFLNLFLAALDGNDLDVLQAAEAVGYVKQSDPDAYQAGIVSLIRTACEPLLSDQPYDFGHSDLAKRIADITYTLRMQEKFGRLPPPDVLFIHRKLGGLYMLFSRLNASIPVRKVIQPYLDDAI